MASISKPPGYVDSKVNIWLDVQPVETPRKPNWESTFVSAWALCLVSKEGKGSKMHLGVRALLGITGFSSLNISSICRFSSMSDT